MSISLCFFFQAEDGIRDLVRSRGLGDVYKRQVIDVAGPAATLVDEIAKNKIRVISPAVREVGVGLSLIHI